MKRSKRCRACGEKPSLPHAEGCGNALRDCEFKNRKKREAKR